MRNTIIRSQRDGKLISMLMQIKDVSPQQLWSDCATKPS